MLSVPPVLPPPMHALRSIWAVKSSRWEQTMGRVASATAWLERQGPRCGAGRTRLRRRWPTAPSCAACESTAARSQPPGKAAAAAAAGAAAGSAATACSTRRVSRQSQRAAAAAVLWGLCRRDCIHRLQHHAHSCSVVPQQACCACRSRTRTALGERRRERRAPRSAAIAGRSLTATTTMTTLSWEPPRRASRQDAARRAWTRMCEPGRMRGGCARANAAGL